MKMYIATLTVCVVVGVGAMVLFSMTTNPGYLLLTMVIMCVMLAMGVAATVGYVLGYEDSYNEYKTMYQSAIDNARDVVDVRQIAVHNGGEKLDKVIFHFSKK